MPRGWFYFEQINYNRVFSDVIQPGIDYPARRMNPTTLKQKDQALAEALGEGWTQVFNHRLLARMLLPALPNAQKKFAIAQTTVDEASLASALERFRLANGHYPEALTELAPRFVPQLPHDLVTGEPLKYRLTDNGRFILYSVGWNEKDDGGKIALTAGKTPSVDSTEGDWVWPSP